MNAPGGLCRQVDFHAASAQFREAGAPTFPLLPGDSAQPSPDPRIQTLQHRRGFAEAEVAAPSSEIARQVFDDPCEACALAAPRQLADLRLEPGQGLRRDAPLRLCPARKAEAQELSLA